eukprot:Awhi_evm1s1436
MQHEQAYYQNRDNNAHSLTTTKKQKKRDGKIETTRCLISGAVNTSNEDDYEDDDIPKLIVTNNSGHKAQDGEYDDIPKLIVTNNSGHKAQDGECKKKSKWFGLKKKNKRARRHSQPLHQRLDDSLAPPTFVTRLRRNSVGSCHSEKLDGSNDHRHKKLSRTFSANINASEKVCRTNCFTSSTIDSKSNSLSTSVHSITPTNANLIDDMKYHIDQSNVYAQLNKHMSETTVTTNNSITNGDEDSKDKGLRRTITKKLMYTSKITFFSLEVLKNDLVGRFQKEEEEGKGKNTQSMVDSTASYTDLGSSLVSFFYEDVRTGGLTRNSQKSLFTKEYVALAAIFLAGCL